MDEVLSGISMKSDDGFHFEDIDQATDCPSFDNTAATASDMQRFKHEVGYTANCSSIRKIKLKTSSIESECGPLDFTMTTSVAYSNSAITFDPATQIVTVDNDLVTQGVDQTVTITAKAGNHDATTSLSFGLHSYNCNIAPSSATQSSYVYTINS